MAEVFAAVASGAGLVSLAIQLLESSQKLKSLYNSSRNAPTTVGDLCFELETLSLQLRQLERHRQNDHLDTEVLDRCIGVCAKRTARVQDVVEAMSRYMRKCAAFGGLYSAFKEPEMRRLLEDLEQAKSSLSLAYIAYCQSWNMRNSLNQAMTLQRHCDLLALQQSQLGCIQDKVSNSKALVTSEVKASSTGDHEGKFAAMSRRYRARQKRFCLPLPIWLTSRTWMVATFQSHGSWTVEIHPVNRRPFGAAAFDCIRRGDIAGLQKGLDTGNLSIWDVIPCSLNGPHTTLLGFAICEQQFELSKHLVDTFEYFQRGDQLLNAMECFLYNLPNLKFRMDVIELFAGKYNMDVDVIGSNTEVPFVLQYEFRHLSRVILSNQSVALENMPLQDRFNTSMRFLQETPAEFLNAVGLAVGPQLVSLTNSDEANVLHWAAKKWTMLEHAQPSVLSMYTNFVSELVKAGVPVSAIDRYGRTPLMHILGASSYNPDEWPWYDECSYAGLVHLVKLWGSTLAGAGVSLEGYIGTENSVVGAWETKHDLLAIFRNRRMLFTGLCLAADGTLATMFKFVETIRVYARIEPPGSFVQEKDFMPRLCPGYPPTCDELWEEINSKELVSESSTLDPNDDSINEVEFELDRILFQGTQDDHGIITAIFRRNEHRIRRERDAVSSDFRSSSAPPAARRFVQYPTPVSRFGRIRDWHTGWLCDRHIYAHKCLFDLQWGFVAQDGYFYDHKMWKTCMKGCRGRPDHAAGIYDYLLTCQSSVSQRRTAR